MSILISAFNHHRIRFGRALAPLPINLIFDLIIFAVDIPYACIGFVSLFGQGGCGYNNGYRYDLCRKYKIAILAVASVTMASGIILG